MSKEEAEKLLRKTIQKFVEEEVKPVTLELDEKAEFPRELFEKLGEMGTFGIRYPKDVGGASCKWPTTMYCVISEELARGYMALAAINAMQSLMGTNFMFKHGNEDHHERLLKPALRGEKVAAFCLTEPDAGTDLTSIRTSAVADGDEFVINGTKTWITNAPVADFFTVLCQTDKSKGIKGVNFFLLERDTPGLSTSKKFDKIGTKSAIISELTFNNCRIPKENRLGGEGRGIGNLMRILAEIRTMTAALSLGLARAAFEESMKYASERVQFGRPIEKYQLIQSKLSQMATNIEASRMLTYKAAGLIDEGKECMMEASMAKYFASETACMAADEATRIYGSYSYSTEYPIQRFWTDTRFLLFGGGTSEILQTIIFNELKKRKNWS